MNAAAGPRDDVSLDRVKHGQTDVFTSHTSHTTGLLRLLSVGAHCYDACLLADALALVLPLRYPSQRFQTVLTRSPHSTSCPTLFIHV
ncbi:hypothetical protein K525DRAFT_275694 [Schizophyllum commune Loenen D]|nr:hypothetical protein K525DRAFT_275694 [Schizophyllum commune Loenen D]